MNYNLASNVFTNIDALHIINIICKISINEDLADFTSLIQKQLLPTLGATIWVWYWQDSEQAPLELISVVNSQKYYSISNNPTPPTLDIDQQLFEDNVPLLSRNEHFDFQDKTALLSLLKKHSLSKVKNNFNTHYKAIIHTPELIGFSVLGLNKIVPCHYQLIELIAPIMLLQKRNLIRKDMLRHYRTMFNEFGEECCLVILDQTCQVIDCTDSFKKLFPGDYLYSNEVIGDILGLANPEKRITELYLLDNFKSECRSGRWSYEVTIKIVDFDHSEKQCFGLVRLNRLFNHQCSPI